ncbi:Angiopoietin-like 1 [Halocaridina rubra]|uniref:Angiopoietin-like 1 n=1 Tax=Halocaridina rubra TaxID=373956 RepID=A0AAN8WXT4_HALRR
MIQRTSLFALCLCYAFVYTVSGKTNDDSPGLLLSPVPEYREAPVSQEDVSTSKQLVLMTVNEYPTEAVRLSLADAEFHTLARDLDQALDQNVHAMDEEILSSIDTYEKTIDITTQIMTSKLQYKFSKRLQESIDIMTKIFALTTSDIKEITTQLQNVSLFSPGIALSSIPSLVTTPQISSFPEHCGEALRMGIPTGVVTIKTAPERTPQRVWCDQDNDRGGWTIILRRQPQINQLDFKRNWEAYVEGFGDPYGEYWIGLEALYQLTMRGTYQLKIRMKAGKDKAFSTYDSFRVSSPENMYQLHVGSYNETFSNAGDAMTYHDGHTFTTIDADNDGASGGNCANWSGGGGWWYNYCFMTNPTGRYPPANDTSGTDRYMEWRTWQGHHVYLSHLVMMIRRTLP